MGLIRESLGVNFSLNERTYFLSVLTKSFDKESELKSLCILLASTLDDSERIWATSECVLVILHSYLGALLINNSTF